MWWETKFGLECNSSPKISLSLTSIYLPPLHTPLHSNSKFHSKLPRQTHQQININIIPHLSYTIRVVFQQDWINPELLNLWKTILGPTHSTTTYPCVLNSWIAINGASVRGYITDVWHRAQSTGHCLSSTPTAQTLPLLARETGDNPAAWARAQLSVSLR